MKALLAFLAILAGQIAALWYAYSVGKLTENLTLISFGIVFGAGLGMITLKWGEA